MLRFLRPPRLPALLRYASAPAVTLAVALVQAALLPEPAIAPFVFFFFGVAVVAWLAGAWPGVASALMSAAIANYFFVPPYRHWELAGPPLTASLLFLVAASATAILCGSLREAMTAVEAELRARELDEQERATTAEFLHLLNDAHGVQALVRVATAFFRAQSGCEAVGIRLRRGGDYPYREALGFGEDFVRAENSLCSRDTLGVVQHDSHGAPELDCLCGAVIKGEVGLWQPFSTSEGSFWTNEMSSLPSALLGELTATRRRCVRAGYESVALIKLRFGDDPLGLVQLNDRRRGRFSAEGIARWERLAGYLAVAVGKASAEESLRDADRRKNDFMAMLSHELRNPLAPMRTSLVIMERSVPGSEQFHRAQRVIGRQLTHVTRIIDDLLDVTRVSRGIVALQRERLDLSELVRRTVDTFAGLFAERGVTLELDVPDAPTWVHGDGTRLEQVLGNLLHNAAKFTPAGGATHVSLRASVDGRVALRVRDTGVGVAPEKLAHVFQPFNQAAPTLDRAAGGLGLGLTLVKALVELHGGSVAAESDGPGTGAELTVVLPLAAPSETAPGLASAVARGAGRRVLIIEDNVDAADSLREVLELDGHAVTVAHDGSEGLERARELVPEVVLCDIGLPGMDGYEVARTFVADPVLKEIPLVAVTGYAGPEDKRRAIEAGFSRHVAKPLTLDALDQLFAALLAPAAQAHSAAPRSSS